MPWLSICIFLPALLAAVCYLFPKKSNAAWAIAGAGLLFLCLLIVYLVYQFPFSTQQKGPFSGYAWVEQRHWFNIRLGENNFPIDYLLGVDGISLPLMALAAFVFFIGLLVAYINRQRFSARFISPYLLLLGVVMGTLCSLDLLLFFIFFELISLPVYFLISAYGSPISSQAASQFLIYSLVGSVLFLLVVLGIYSSLNPTWDKALHMGLFFNPEVYAPTGLLTPYLRDSAWSQVACVALLVSFAIKLAIVPFHGWLPFAHVEASTPISIVLAGVILKLGGYAMLRVGWSVFHEYLLDNGEILMWIGAFSILYGVLNALAQQDLKRMIAYSSIGHMGLVWLGIMSSMENSLIGAIYQMISHGFIVAGLFLISDVLESRFKSRQIGDFSGLAQHMPWYAVLCTLFFFANFGMPGSASFIAEVFIIMGFLEACVAQHLKWHVLLPIGTGMLVAASCWIWTFRRLFQGTYYIKGSLPPPKDIRWDKRSLLTVLVVLVYLLGIMPQSLLSIIYPSVQHIKELIFMFKI